MFDVEALIADCLRAIQEPDAQRSVREVLLSKLDKTGPVALALGKNEAGLNVIYNSDALTIMNVIWAPYMQLLPHDHRMWAVIGIYGGSEENLLYRRGPEKIQRAGERTLSDGDVFALGVDAIHAVVNPERRFTGAIHIYGGDFVNQPRSQWDPDTLTEGAYSYEEIRALFAAANRAWREQVGTDLEESSF